jgi:hypothetical protein
MLAAVGIAVCVGRSWSCGWPVRCTTPFILCITPLRVRVSGPGVSQGRQRSSLWQRYAWAWRLSALRLFPDRQPLRAGELQDRRHLRPYLPQRWPRWPQLRSANCCGRASTATTWVSLRSFTPARGADTTCMSCDTHVGPLPVSAACSLFLTVESARMGCQKNRELRLCGVSRTRRRAGLSGKTPLPALGGPASMAESARFVCDLRRPAQVTGGGPGRFICHRTVYQRHTTREIPLVLLKRNTGDPKC